MAEVKSLASIREKWARVTPGRTEDYRLGVQNPKRDWAEETLASKDNYKLGIDAAHAKGLFEKGVREAGSSKWKDKALKKGPGRFAEGVMVGAADYEKGFAPFREAIEACDLGPKFPKRDPRNIDRVKRINDALIAKKLGS